MNAKRIVKLVVVAVALVGVIGVSACHRHHTPAERAEWMTGKIAKHLNLDDQQKVKLEAVKDEVLAARAESQKEHRGIMEEVIAQVQSEWLDQAKLAQLIEQHPAGQTRMMQRVLPKVAEWYASLRPEQKAEAVGHIRRWMEHHEMIE